MKSIVKLSLTFLASVATVVTLSNKVIAGQGGIAASAAFTIDNTGATPVVNGVSVSSAIGKEGATAAAFNAPTAAAGATANSTFAVGYSGNLTLTGIGDPVSASILTTQESDTGRAIVQANEIGATAPNTLPGSIQIGSVSGDTVIQN